VLAKEDNAHPIATMSVIDSVQYLIVRKN